MDESRLLERRAFRRRSLVALAASLVIHGALFTLLVFLIPTDPSASAESLAVNLQDGDAHRRASATPGGRSAGERGGNRRGPAIDEARKLDAGAETSENALGDISTDRSGGKDKTDGEAIDAATATNASNDGPSSRSVVSEGGASSFGDGATAGGRGEAGASAGGGSGPGSPGVGGDPAALVAARVLAAVEARKAYPEAAKRRGTEGTVRLKFSVAEDGRLLSAKLVASSGSALLDRAALDLFASVFPVDNVARRRLDGLALSINYGLKR